ncbi:hypothetical protein CPC08DRAFT_821931 [Agrocybe pediades]|nr:hypothetical protein CPC08DRAFT_821931 [Agrocybe pediades]
MSDSHFLCLVNKERPRVELDYQSVQVNLLGTGLTDQLLLSLTQIDASDGNLCAKSARLWESLLERHRVPYVLLRVADMRMSLGSKVTAIALYEEVNSILGDGPLGKWIDEVRLSCMKETAELLSFYKSDSAIFDPSLKWKPHVADQPFPDDECKLSDRDALEIEKHWKCLKCNKMEREYLRKQCLETNYIEGTFCFDGSTDRKIFMQGFETDTSILKDPIRGSVRRLDTALDILCDTEKALKEIYTFLDPDNPRELTVPLICSIHATLMKTSRVLYDESNYADKRLRYTNIGVTRQTSRVDVTVETIRDDKAVRLQFCPWDEVDAELTRFCKRFNEIIRHPSMDPFACAAWISHVFVTIHPFEDGNGRMSRILASIPLVRRGLSPICVSRSWQSAYVLNLNRVRCGDPTDPLRFLKLVDTLAYATDSALGTVGLTGMVHRADFDRTYL